MVLLVLQAALELDLEKRGEKARNSEGKRSRLKSKDPMLERQRTKQSRPVHAHFPQTTLKGSGLRSTAMHYFNLETRGHFETLL